MPLCKVNMKGIKEKLDEIIFRAGIPGLLFQYKLLELGCKVLLIEKKAFSFFAATFIKRMTIE
jgi:hypothetical protein